MRRLTVIMALAFLSGVKPCMRPSLWRIAAVLVLLRRETAIILAWRQPIFCRLSRLDILPLYLPMRQRLCRHGAGAKDCLAQARLAQRHQLESCRPLCWICRLQWRHEVKSGLRKNVASRSLRAMRLMKMAKSRLMQPPRFAVLFCQWVAIKDLGYRC